MKLTQPVTVRGRNYLGFTSTATIAPYDAPGIWWRLGNGRILPMSDSAMGVNPFLKCLVLHLDGEKIRIPEHVLGVIFLLDISGILITPHPKRGLPYEESGRRYWDALLPAVEEQPDIFQTYTVKGAVECRNGRCQLRWEPGEQPLTVRVSVQYPGTEQVTIEETIHPGTNAAVARARSVGRRYLLPYAWAHRVRDQYVWLHAPQTTAEMRKALKEVARHRALDLLGALTLLLPPDGRLGGSITTAFAGHAADVELMERITEQKLLVPA